MQLRKLPLSALRAFEAAARHLSFSSAARELGVTPAAVSLQIRSLEARLGRQLFIRRNRTLKLSQTGAKISSPLTDLFAQMASLVADASARSLRSLEVSAMPSFATKWLAPRLARFTVAHPDWVVRLVATDELLDFKEGRSDVGVRYGPGAYKDLHAELLMDVVAYPVCSPEFAKLHERLVQSPAALLEAPLLHDESSLIAAGLPTWRSWFDAAGERAFVSPRKTLVFDSAYLALEAALASQGVALGLSPLVADDIKSGRLVKLFDTSVASAFGFWFVCRRTRIKDPRVAQFRDWLITESRPS